MESINKKSDRILNLYIDESITKDEYNKKKEELSVLKDNIQSQITKLNEANDNFEITVEYLLDVASRSYSLFKSSGIDTKRKILKLVFPNFYLDGQNLSYDIRKPFDMFVKRANHLKIWSICRQNRTFYCKILLILYQIKFLFLLFEDIFVCHAELTRK